MRIVSLVPSITENLILFGCAPVARTSFCIEPKERVKDIPVIGGTKTLKIEKIIALHPDLVIANREENRKEDVEALEKAGLRVWLSYPITVAEGIAFMKELSELCPKNPETQKIIASCEETFNSLQNRSVLRRPRVVTLIWKDPWMVVGGQNYMNDMVKVAGGQNPFEGKEGRYPKVAVEEVLDAKPDLILLPSEPYEFSVKDRDFWRGVVKTEFFSGEDLCWFGPRMSRGLTDLANVISVS